MSAGVCHAVNTSGCLGKEWGEWPAHPAKDAVLSRPFGDCTSLRVVLLQHAPHEPQGIRGTQVRGSPPQAITWSLRAHVSHQKPNPVWRRSRCATHPAIVTLTCLSRASRTSTSASKPHLLEQGLRAGTILQGLAAGHAPAHHLQLQPEKGALAQDAAAVLQQGSDLRGVAAALALQLAAPALQGTQRLLSLGTQSGGSLAVALTPAGPKGEGSVLLQAAAGLDCGLCWRQMALLLPSHLQPGGVYC